MAAKHLALSLFAFSFLQTSFAGTERFWLFSKDNETEATEAWKSLSEEEQRALIKRYQSLKEIPADQSEALQQRMDWFTQLPEKEKNKMREAWQQMSTQERNDLRVRMQKASNDEKVAIRQEYINKYVTETVNN